ncbi:MAG: primosomal protein N' [Deltaproteobacteria bacterium]|nr:primosomal protein N' [Deltaproteobacteria bacterium]
MTENGIRGKINVAVSLPVRGLFTYDTGGKSIKPGCRVIVRFNGQRVIGYAVDNKDCYNGKVLKIIEVIDVEPVLTLNLMKTLIKSSVYYHHPVGEVFKSAHPPLNVNISRIRVTLSASGKEFVSTLGEKLIKTVEDRFLLTLDGKGRLKSKIKSKEISTAKYSNLLKYGYISENEEIVKNGPSGTTKAVIKVNSVDDPDIKSWLSKGKIRESLYRELRDSILPVKVSEIRNSYKNSSTKLNELQEKKLIVMDEISDDTQWISWDLVVPDPHHKLNPEQQTVLNKLIKEPDGFSVHLIHGVTGSGKTEIYMHTIRHMLDLGKTSVVIVPEIALTPQLSARFRAFFGDVVSILHSGLTSLQRAIEWRRLSDGKARIAIGARSAIFAPVRDVGVIVVDEEHDSSFKQAEGFRYNGRDIAILRGQEEGAKVILGSATPSLESWNNAVSGKYKLHSLKKRATATKLPDYELVDTKFEKPHNMFTRPMIQNLKVNFNKGNQAMVFLNRRGYFGVLQCTACGYVMNCEDCSVPMTLHRNQNAMVCHYCGNSMPVPSDCPECGVEFSGRNSGTENILEYLQKEIPDAKIVRLDRDTAKFGGIEKLVNAMKNREIDILLGTQMITKGHDFPGVTLVGVLDADHSLFFQDFRAAERTYQLITQVGGRAGRRDEQGKVIIQSSTPQHYAILNAINNDFHSFVENELYSRKELGYPPFGYLCLLNIQDENEKLGFERAENVKKAIIRSGISPLDVLGAAPAPVFKVRKNSRWQVLLKSPSRSVLHKAVRIISDNASLSQGVSIDIDPQTMF